MAETTKIPRERLQEYFDAFTKRFLKDASIESVDVEIMEPEIGDQVLAEGAHLRGVTFDPHDNALELALDVGDHRIYDPEEVWTLEEDDGFLSAIEVVHASSAREVITLKRVGLRRVV